MNNPSSTFHPHPTADEPPRKRATRVHEGGSYKISDTIQEDSLPLNSLPLTAMAQPRVTTNAYIPHASLETISNKIKKLQSDLSGAANGQCFGPGKQKVLDCKHDVDVLAGMVKGLDVQTTSRKESLDVLIEASIDRLFDKHVSKATKAVDDNTKHLIRDALGRVFTSNKIKEAIKEGLENEPDVLLDFEAKSMRYFKEALADAVARMVAERNRLNVSNQLMNI